MRIVNDLRQSFENPAITTDVMVGFAGETDGEFAESLDFVESVGFAKVHVFPYSRRKGTLADKMDGQVDPRVKDDRSKKMIEISEQGRRAFLNSQLGKTESVLVERKREGGYFEGYTMNYTPVRIFSEKALTGKIVDVKLTRLGDDWCEGEL